MPNYVTNVLTIQAEPEEVRRILSAIQNDEVGFGSISFQKILPMPPELDIECGSRSRRGLELYQVMRQEREVAGDLTPEAEAALREKYEKMTDGDPAMLDLGEQCYFNLEEHGWHLSEEEGTYVLEDPEQSPSMDMRMK